VQGQKHSEKDFTAVEDSALTVHTNEPFAGVQQIAVLGLGAWGSTLAQLAQQRGHLITGWRRPAQGDAQAPRDTSLAAVVSSANLIICALPVKAVQPISEQIAAHVSPGTILLSATKGLVKGTTVGPPQTAAQIWQVALPQNPVAVLSGPNLSVEINQGLPAATVVAGPPEITARVQAILGSPSFRIYTNADRVGVELGGVLKNVIAIACGVSDGLGLGTNARSALITRGLVEMIRVGTHWGGQTATFYGLSGLGDLLTTCTSALSRNYQVGLSLAKGKALNQVLKEIVGTAEGLNTAPVLAAYAAQQNLEIPITQEVCALLAGDKAPAAAISNLINRPFKSEI